MDSDLVLRPGAVNPYNLILTGGECCTDAGEGLSGADQSHSTQAGTLALGIALAALDTGAGSATAELGIELALAGDNLALSSEVADLTVRSARVVPSDGAYPRRALVTARVIGRVRITASCARIRITGKVLA